MYDSLESFPTVAAVAAVEVDAELRAVVRAGRALVHVNALLLVGRRDDPALEARADVAARAAELGQVRAEVLAATCGEEELFETQIRTNLVLDLGLKVNDPR